MSPDLLVLLLAFIFGGGAMLGGSGSAAVIEDEDDPIVEDEAVVEDGADDDAEDDTDDEGEDDAADEDDDADDDAAEDDADDEADAEDDADDDADADDEADDPADDDEVADDPAEEDDDPIAASVRTENALDEDATDFLFGPNDFPDEDDTLDVLVDENVDLGTDTVVLADNFGSTDFEDEINVQFLSEDSGPQTYDDAAGDTYVIGSTGSDALAVMAGRVIANLGEGDDTYSDAGLMLDERVLDEDGDFVERGTTSLATESGGLNRGIESDGVNNEVQRVYAGEGNDTIDVRAGGGLVYGDDGDDQITVGAAAAYVRGGAGDDVIVQTGTADDAFTDFQWAMGEADNDTIQGSAQSDFLFGDSYEARDSDGDDEIIGGAGNDEIWGGGGSDVIDGGADNDTLYGGAANYLINVTPSNGDGTNFAWYTDNTADTIIAGDGQDDIYADQFDTVDLSNDATSGTADLDIVRVSYDTTLDSDQSALIQSFDPEADVLLIRLDPSQLPEDAIDDFYNEDILAERSLRTDDGDAGVQLDHELTVVDGNTVVSVNGFNVAVLEGITEDQHEDLNINARVWLEVEETDPNRA